MDGTVPAAVYKSYGSCRTTTLIDVLSTCQPAAQRISSELLSGYWHRKNLLSSPRLACKELRRAIDSQVPKLKLILNSTCHHQCWAEGQLPSLSGFTACSSLHLHIVLDSRSDSARLAALVALPFLGLELSARQCIKELVLAVSSATGHYVFSEPCSGETAIAAAAAKLPNLRYLDLQCMPMSRDSLLQQQMFKALADLPYLQHLVLPNVSVLNNVVNLVGSSRLTTICVGSGEGSLLSLQGIEGISRLQQLKNLRINSCACDLSIMGVSGDAAADAEASRLQHLLINLPASLEKLSFDVRLEGGSEYCLDFAAHNGLLDGVEIFMATLNLPAQAASFSGLLDLLLQTGQWNSSRPVICIKEATIHIDEPLVGPEAERLVTQLQSCHLQASMITAPLWHLALDAVCLATSVPRFLTLTSTGLNLGPFISSDEQQRPQQQQQVQVSRRPHAMPLLPPTTSISTPQLAQMVVHVLCNTIVNMDTLLSMTQTPVAGSDGKSIAASAQVHSPEQVLGITGTNDGPAPPVLLLLHGHLISKLAATSPFSLASWLQDLADRATQAAGLEAACDRLFKSYLLLPAPTAAVIVECSPEVGSVGHVHAVRRSLAFVLPQDTLQVSAVAGKPWSIGSDEEEDDYEWIVDMSYQGAFKQVLMTVWDYLTTRLDGDPQRLREALVHLLEVAAPLGEDLEWGEL